MASWFNRKKKSVDPSEIKKLQVKDINYPAKIVVAWAKAIEGNNEILLWLKENGYEELFMATYAILLKDEAREWLSENGYPHLLAMINAAEGNEQAQSWLKFHQFDLLYHVALAVEGEVESFEWIGKNAPADIFLLTQSIKKVKDDIEENHNDIHSFRKDV